MRGKYRIIAALAGLLLVVLQVSPAAFGPAGEAAVPVAVLSETAPFTPWSGDVAQLQPAIEIQRGQECPGGSGSYCSDQFPVCCASGGQFRCQASRASC